MAKITVALLKDLEQQVILGELSYSKMVEILNSQSLLNENNKYEFYKVREDKKGYKGERYFKFKWDSSHAIQVCLDTSGQAKRGKGHYIGIYQITRMTLFTNWFPNYVESCTEKEFNEAFNKAIILLNAK